MMRVEIKCSRPFSQTLRSWGLRNRVIGIPLIRKHLCCYCIVERAAPRCAIIPPPNVDLQLSLPQN